MDMQNLKCVMVIDEKLPLGIIANTAAILGITLGCKLPEAVGPDVMDKTGQKHLGIIQYPVPILKGNSESIYQLREKLYQPDFSSLITIDFSELAQGCNDYEAFILKMHGEEEKDLQYLGVAICGDKKMVNKLTGNLPLLR